MSIIYLVPVCLVKTETEIKRHFESCEIMERVVPPLSQSAIVESLHSDHSSLYSMTLSNINIRPAKQKMSA